MEFALNYSTQAAALLREGRIEIDRFKCPDWSDLVAQALAIRPVYVHFPLRAGTGTVGETDWSQIHAFLEQTNTPCVNLHLAPKVKDFPGIPTDTQDPTHVEMIVERMIADVEQVVVQFGSDRVIVENVPLRIAEDKFLRPAVEPAVIRRVVEATGCGLLLDLSHARITARNLDLDEREYVSQLPVERLRELHITGLGLKDGRLADHLPMTSEDWPAVEWAFERIGAGDWARPLIVAVEYGGVGASFAWRSNAAVIAADVPRLYALHREASIAGARLTNKSASKPTT